MLSNPATKGEIEGYASATSVNRGDGIDFYVNTSSTASTYNIDIFRMGYYNSHGARLMKSFSNISGKSQSFPCINPDNVVECNWSISQHLEIPDVETKPSSTHYWASGIYLAKLTMNDVYRKDSYIIFVVRDDARAATYVAQLPITTYQAYNYWGGQSLYTGCAYPDISWKCSNGAKRSTAVSFNRPFGPSSNPRAAYGVGAGEFITNVQPVHEGYKISSAGWDYNMVRWMEKQGYDIKYITNIDLHENNQVFNQATAFISTGHDEYYSKPMWDNLMNARSNGINMGFFSANQIYWQVRFINGTYGTIKRNRIMICYKGERNPLCLKVTGKIGLHPANFCPLSRVDPIQDDDLTTGLFRDLGRPEATLIGNQYVTNPIMGDITITNASHWIFTGTGAENGTVLKGLLGYEINCFESGKSPPNTVILAHSPSGRSYGDMTYYVHPSSAQVFATGSMQWSWGLDNFISNHVREDYTSPIAQKITANVFQALGARSIARMPAPISYKKIPDFS